jgi:type I restriction enzyme S subunit
MRDSLYSDYAVPEIAELLDRLCPDGVNEVQLQNLLKHEQPGKYQVQSTEYDPEAPTPVLTPGKGFLLGYTHEKEGVYPASEDRPVIIFDDFTTNFHWVDFPFKVKSSAMKMLSLISDDADLRYIYWAMQMLRYTPAEHARQWLQTYSLFEIPLPPIDVQHRIVAILDDFTNLEASLQRELKLRERQFSYALDKVFSYSDHPTKPLGDLGSFTKGKGITKAQLLDDGVPAMHYGQVHTSYGHTAQKTISFVQEDLVKNPTLAKIGDIVLATTSEDDEAVGKAVAWLGDEDVIVGGDAHAFSHSLEPRYVSYYFASHSFQRQKQTKLTGAKVRRINDKGLASLSIPVPPADEQSRIADRIEMIDRYMQGINREIELRQKQLEHYRDQLLTFPTK